MMDNSKIEKAKVFPSKIPMRMRAVQPSNKEKVVTSRIPMMSRAVKPSNEKYCTKPSALIETGRRLTQVASQSANSKTTNSNSKNTNIDTNAAVRNGNTKTTESRLSNKKYINIPTKTVIKKPPESIIENTNRRLTNAAVHNENKKFPQSNLASNIYTKTVSKKPTAESTNRNKKVDEVKNQDNRKSTSIKSSNMNRRLTNVNNSNFKAPLVSHKNVINRRLTNISKKRPVDIGTQNKAQNNRAEQQTTLCNNEETNIDKVVDTSFIKSKEDIKLKGSTSSIHSQEKASIPENNNKNLNHFSQSDIEFVADEKYRHQILSGKGLSPIKKPLNKVKCSSIYERPSIYSKSSQTPFDIKTALKRLEDEGRRISTMKMNNVQPHLLPSPCKYERQSIFKSSQTPFDINSALKRLEEEGRRISVMKMSAISSSQLAMKNKQPSILKAIENVNPASENNKAFVLKNNPLSITSPRWERGPQKSDSPYETVLKRLQELQMKKKVKSSKKVTFNLDTSGSSSKVFKHDSFKTKDLKDQPTDDGDENHKTSKLIHNSPVSEPHSSTESPKEVKRDITESHYNAMLLRICGRPITTSAQKKTNFHLQENKSLSKQIQSDIYSDKQPSASSLKTPAKKDFTLPSTPTLELCAKESSLSPSSPVEKLSIATHSAVSQSIKPDFQTNKTLKNTIMASSALRSSLYLSRSQAVAESGLRRNTLSRLCTPKPVSFYPRTNNCEISPEFMGRRTSCIVANAPISTPMVLRNLAESFEETLSPVAQDTISPVCQRLDFDEIEKETDGDDALQDCESSNELQKRPVQNSFRCKNIMDQLTDQECCKILENTAFSVIFERRLLNPIAKILSHGDDMHFVPLKLV